MNNQPWTLDVQARKLVEWLNGPIDNNALNAELVDIRRYGAAEKYRDVFRATRTLLAESLQCWLREQGEADAVKGQSPVAVPGSIGEALAAYGVEPIAIAIPRQERPFKIGDKVRRKPDGLTGTVREIQKMHDGVIMLGVQIMPQDAFVRWVRADEVETVPRTVGEALAAYDTSMCTNPNCTRGACTGCNPVPDSDEPQAQPAKPETWRDRPPLL